MSHDVTIETDMDGEMLLACSCGATSNIDGYSIALADVIIWAVNHPNLPPLPSQ